MDIWDGQPHRLFPGKDFFPVKYVASVLEPVSEADGDVLMEVVELEGMDKVIAEVNNGFNAYATRLTRVAEAFGLTVRTWYSTPKGPVENKSYRLSPENITEYWVQVTSPVEEEIHSVLVR